MTVRLKMKVTLYVDMNSLQHLGQHNALILRLTENELSDKVDTEEFKALCYKLYFVKTLSK